MSALPKTSLKKSKASVDATIQEFHYAPGDHQRERKRSILKEPKDDEAIDIEALSHSQRRSRKSSRKNHVLFDATVENLSTITKIRGLTAALKMNTGRMKFHAQVSHGGPTGDLIGDSDYVEERYPPHLKSFQKTPLREGCYEIDPGTGPITTDENKLENKTARQDLARIYFTNEATRLVACSNLRTLNTTLGRKKTPPKQSQAIPHFFMERLMADQEAAKRRETYSKIKKLKSELDAFDRDVMNTLELESCSPFDPRLKKPEKSLRLVKQKMEMLKLQRDRDSKSTTKRCRCRKAYFHQMLPTFDAIEKDLMDYVDGLLPRQSNSEMRFMKELNDVANHRLFQEYDRSRAVQDAIDVVFETSMKIVGHKYASGEVVSTKLAATWRDKVYDDILGVEYCGNVEAERERKAMEKHQPLQPHHIHFDWEKNKAIQDTVDCLLETTVKVANSRCTTGKDPPKTLEAEWRGEVYDAIDCEEYFEPFYNIGLECSEITKALHEMNEIGTKRLFQDCVNMSESARVAHEALEVLFDTTMKILNYRYATGDDPSIDREVEWRGEAYSAIDGLDEDSLDGDSEAAKAAQDALGVLMETVMDVIGYRYINDEDPPLNVEMEWRSDAYTAIDWTEFSDFEDDLDAGKNVEDILEVIFETAMKIANYRHAAGENPPESVEMEWIEEAYAAVDGLVCVETAGNDSDASKTVNIVLDVLLETVMKVAGHRESTGEDPPLDVQAEWREEIYAAIGGWEYVENVEVADTADESRKTA